MVLRELVGAIDHARRTTGTKQELVCTQFVQAGQEVQTRQDKAIGLLTSEGRSEMQADVGRKLVFPPSITTTTQRPDIVLWSVRHKQLVMVELSVPWEERA
jgi:hypothetical protein